MHSSRVQCIDDGGRLLSIDSLEPIMLHTLIIIYDQQNSLGILIPHAKLSWASFTSVCRRKRLLSKYFTAEFCCLLILRDMFKSIIFRDAPPATSPHTLLINERFFSYSNVLPTRRADNVFSKNTFQNNIEERKKEKLKKRSKFWELVDWKLHRENRIVGSMRSRRY